MLKAAHAHLLVTAKQKAYLALEGQSGGLYGGKSVYCGYGGALIVQHAAAYHGSVDYVCGEGVAAPALSLGYNVQVRQHSKRLVPRAVIRVAYIAVHIGIRKAEAVADAQNVFKGLLALRSEGGSGLCQLRMADALKAHQLLKILYHILAVLFYPKVYLAVHVSSS